MNVNGSKYIYANAGYSEFMQRTIIAGVVANVRIANFGGKMPPAQPLALPQRSTQPLDRHEAGAKTIRNLINELKGFYVCHGGAMQLAVSCHHYGTYHQ